MQIEGVNRTQTEVAGNGFLAGARRRETIVSIPRCRLALCAATMAFSISFSMQSAQAGGPVITSELTLIENRPPNDLFGLTGLNLSLRATVSHPDGPAGFSGPLAGATSEAADNHFPFPNPVPLTDFESFPGEMYFIRLLPIAEADFPNLNGRYRYRVTDAVGQTDTILGHNLNRMEAIPLPTNLATSNLTTTPVFSFTDPDPTPNVGGLSRIYHVWIIDENLQGVAHLPPPGGSPTPSIAIPPGILCPCKAYYLRAESVDVDTADAAVENLATAYLPFKPTAVAPNGDMTHDCKTNGRDMQPFVNAVRAGSIAIDDLCPGDFNGNGTMDAGDVPGFVAALLAA